MDSKGRGRKRGPYRQYLRDTTQLPPKLKRKLTMVMAGVDPSQGVNPRDIESHRTSPQGFLSGNPEESTSSSSDAIHRSTSTRSLPVVPDDACFDFDEYSLSTSEELATEHNLSDENEALLGQTLENTDTTEKAGAEYADAGSGLLEDFVYPGCPLTAKTSSVFILLFVLQHKLSNKTAQV
ncbi:uncharacterized protein LOC134194557 [Corticium candelabrum]|uniref:uncharacterized protein LOC134194557 n=1 Tax=Corticium candelabrum TaxID=121492 RepID=UPI002E25905B|nr:uncharacterized protein LOC134194557 [Corticium candelabrum]